VCLLRVSDGECETHSYYTDVLCRRNAVRKSAVTNMATTQDIEVMCDKCNVRTSRFEVQSRSK